MLQPVSWRRKIASALTAGAFALGSIGTGMALSFSNTPSAHAAIGVSPVVGDGDPNSKWSDQIPLTLFFDDRNVSASYEPSQGWEQASITPFMDSLEQAATQRGFQAFSPTTKSKIIQSCTNALAIANQRDPSAGKARVVGLMIMYAKGGLGWTDKGDTYFDGVWDSVKGGLQGWDSSDEDYIRLHDEFRQAANVSKMAVTCAAANANEPPKPHYNLNIATDKNSSVVKAGSQDVVSDMVHASNSHNISESLNATVRLWWDSPEGGSDHREKAFTLTSNGDTRSPEFVPGDFGWDSWPAGSFWFDVVVPQQGEMAVAVDTPDRDPRESWTAEMDRSLVKELFSAGTTIPVADLVAGQVYDARIRFHSNGASQLVAHDLIFTDEVFVKS